MTGLDEQLTAWLAWSRADAAWRQAVDQGIVRIGERPDPATVQQVVAEVVAASIRRNGCARVLEAMGLAIDPPTEG